MDKMTLKTAGLAVVSIGRTRSPRKGASNTLPPIKVHRPRIPTPQHIKDERLEEGEDDDMKQNPREWPFPTFHRNNPYQNTSRVCDLVDMVREDNQKALQNRHTNLQRYIVHSPFVLPRDQRKAREALVRSEKERNAIREEWKMQNLYLSSNNTYVGQYSPYDPLRLRRKDKRRPSISTMDAEKVIQPIWIRNMNQGEMLERKAARGFPQLGIRPKN